MERFSASADPYFTENSDQHNTPDDALSDYSEKDKPWDTNRAYAQDVQEIYLRDQEFQKLGDRISNCSGMLRFNMVASKQTGEVSLKLSTAYFCRVRHCPVCQWRRSLMWQARFYQALPAIIEQYPTSRWLLLTLTVPNCKVEDLAKTLSEMNKAWQRLIKRKEFKVVQGWIRATEVTQEEKRKEYAHPHFHCLMMVPSSYFKTSKYITRDRWLELWQEAMRDASITAVDVRPVKPRKPKDGQTITDSTVQALEASGGVSETLKYSVKPSDMINDPAWFLEMTRQVHKKRFLAAGGALKDMLKETEESEEDLLLKSEDDGITEVLSDGYLYAFNWRSDDRIYRRYEKGDVFPTTDD